MGSGVLLNGRVVGGVEQAASNQAEMNRKPNKLIV
jgi:hypothetical protein